LHIDIQHTADPSTGARPFPAAREIPGAVTRYALSSLVEALATILDEAVSAAAMGLPADFGLDAGSLSPRPGHAYSRPPE
jgi:hypothetical protein